MIRPLSSAHAIFIAERLRPHDRAEVAACWWADDAVSWAQATAQLPSKNHFVALAADGVPVAMGGFLEIWPHVVQAWMVATDRIQEIAITLQRHVLQLHRLAIASGVHRFQANAMVGNHLGMRWLDRLGYESEGTMRRLGRHGEDFLLMARVIGGAACVP